MQLIYDDIRVGERKLVAGGKIELKKGKIIVIHGENGSGKTLMLKNIFHNEKNEKYSMAFADQYNNGVAAGVDVLHNISMRSDGQYNEMVYDRICRWDMSDLPEHTAAKLSGGEKRMVCILRTVFSNADILIFDEPTNDLDYVFVQKLVRILNEIRKEFGIIIVSHDDRIDEIASEIYEVKNGELLQKESHGSPAAAGSEIKPYSGKRLFDLGILKKIFPYNIITLLICIIFMAIVYLQMTDYKKAIGSYDTQIMPENQINAFMPIAFSTGGSGLTPGLPAAVVQEMSTYNPVRQLKALSKLEDIMDMGNIKLDSLDDLQSNEMITVYPLEFYVPEGKESIFTIDYYLQKYYGTTQDLAQLRTDGIFEQPVDYAYDVQAVYDFNREYFDTAAGELRETIVETGKGHLVAAVIVLNEGYSPEDFYVSETCDRMVDNNVYIRCNGVINFIAETGKLRTIVIKSIYIFTAAACVLLMDILAIILFCKNQTAKINIAKNYGYDSYTVRTCFTKKCNNRIPLLVLLAAGIAANIIVFKDTAAAQTNYAFSLYAILFLSLIYWVNNKIAARFIGKAFRWNER